MYELIRNVNKFLKSGMYDYCSLECNDPDDPNNSTFVTKNGGFCTVFRIDGSLTIVGKRKFSDILDEAVDELSGLLKKPGFKLQFVFTRDPASAKRKVDQSINLLRDTIANLDLNLNSMLDERSEVMGRKTSNEECYLVVSTLPGVLDKKTYKTALKNRLDSVKKYGIGINPGEFGQSPHTAVDALRQIHEGFSVSIESVLKKTVIMEKLEVHEAMLAIRKSVNMDMTGDDWKPSMLGDRVPMRLVKESGRKGDVSHVMNPSLAFQLFNQRPRIDEQDSSLVRLGSKIIAPLMVDIPPQDIKPFTDLFEKIDHDVPWRWSFTLETGHKQVMSKISTKSSFATFLSMFSGDNKLIRDAAQELMELAREGYSMTMGYMSFCTWANSLEEANRRKQILAQAASSWGNLDIIEEFGDAIASWMDTIPAMSDKPISTPFPLPIERALTMMPISRPASPWKIGPIQFRTIDGKIYCYEPGSSRQTAWNDIVFAPPGFGKSFFLSASNLALIMNAGNKVLPRIAIIDIGFSSAAFIEMVKAALPPEKRHLAQSFKLEMSKKNTINPFDTPLGCQFPLAIDREFLVNFLTLLLTPAGSDSIPRLPEIAGKIIDAMYEYFQEDNNPKPYEPGRDAEVDAVLARMNFEIDDEDNISWWDVSKQIFRAGFPDESSLAQRYAVPNLSDATAVLSDSSNINDVFGDAMLYGENMISFIEGMLTSVTSEYPILTGPSNFDIGLARVCSMDLSAVAKGGSAQGNKRVGVMYMLARQVMCREFYRDDDTLNEIPSEYRDHHARILEQDAGVPSKLCMDEFHRTKPCPSVRIQAETDMREGRKFNVHVSLLSQMVDDFDDAILGLVNNVFILSKGNSEDTVQKIERIFKPSRDAMRALKLHVNGPGPEGSSMLYLGNLKGKSNAEQIIRLTLGPIEQWAYSTTHEDVRIRAKMAKEIGLSSALRILSAEFPGGSAKDYIKARSAKNDDSDVSVFDLVASELIIKHKGSIAEH